MQEQAVIEAKLAEIEERIKTLRKQLSIKDKRTFNARDLQAKLTQAYHYQAALQFGLGLRTSLTIH